MRHDLDALSLRFPWVPALGQGGIIDLYHAPNSICSQKVRAVLSETGQSYRSHLLDIFRGETYEPVYVRTRVAGCRAAGHRLASDHPGTTSVASTGCDACVVPTVVVGDEIIVDSRRICMELDRRNASAPGALVPSELSDAIAREIAVVDDLPNYQLLAVAVGKPTPDDPDNAFAASKVARCDRLIAEHSNDADLVAGYTAKRAKEQAAADRLFDAAAMERARRTILEALRSLDQRISGPFLFGGRVTLADLFWGVELVRIDDLGLSDSWEGGELPRLAAYYDVISARPAIRHAVLDFPGARLPRKTAA